MPREVVAFYFNGGSDRAGWKLLNPQYFSAATDEKRCSGQCKSLGQDQDTFKVLINFELHKRMQIDSARAHVPRLGEMHQTGLPGLYSDKDLEREARERASFRVSQLHEWGPHLLPTGGFDDIGIVGLGQFRRLGPDGRGRLLVFLASHQRGKERSFLVMPLSGQRKVIRAWVLGR